MSQKILALITDFSDRDYYIGVLKGVIKNIDPKIEIIDVSNEVPSFNTLAASFIVEKTFRYFPASTVFLVVVDPGVGTGRKMIIVNYDGYVFIAPDNGVLTPIIKRKDAVVRILMGSDYYLSKERSTFEARDKMAPIAAHVLKGIDLEKISSEVSSFTLNEEYFPKGSANSIKGRIVYIDNFGNSVTNVSRDFLFGHLTLSRRSKFSMQIGNKRVSGFHKAYSDGANTPFMLIGSHKNLEIAMNKASAAEYLKIDLNQPFTIIFY